MTEHPPLTDDDLSLALDGEADADLLARLDADPAAQARLDELRAAARQVSQPVTPLDADVVDDLIAGAIDTPLAPAVAGTRRGPGRATPWLVAASVVILMAVGLSLVWAGRSSDDDQASAAKTTVDQLANESDGGAGADSSFSDAGSTAESQDLASSHVSPTTAAPATGESSTLPLLFLGTYDDGDALRAATAASLADAWKASGSLPSFRSTDPEVADRTQAALDGSTPPAAASVDRCADQLQTTLSMKAAPIQTGFAVVDGQEVLVYEFATPSAKDADRETTLVAAVGADACDEVVIFER